MRMLLLLLLLMLQVMTITATTARTYRTANPTPMRTRPPPRPASPTTKCQPLSPCSLREDDDWTDLAPGPSRLPARTDEEPIPTPRELAELAQLLGAPEDPRMKRWAAWAGFAKVLEEVEPVSRSEEWAPGNRCTEQALSRPTTQVHRYSAVRYSSSSSWYL
ncbi:hypothetical protein BZA05DRAFT_415799 [Tricharina praecox]|uniref:uncharacterized protein n=1 Tax=Tricharina praecox TaxID=43433 RepID=UPI0022205ED1|nr:uncharacterized protein BZA05DRAFT_415799 [Tricharina praecox]KAI5857110.1 hypothetical protein BZA05DRAFT_415799 [Tricharina praecox]